MTERERWIVYPLLFLAIGSALRNNVAAPSIIRAAKIKCKQIVCEGQIDSQKVVAQQGTFDRVAANSQLTVHGPSKKPFVVMRAAAIPPANGNGAKKGAKKGNRDVVSHQGVIQLLDGQGRVVGSLGRVTVCNQLVAQDVKVRGGELRVYGADDKLKASLGATAIQEPPAAEGDETSQENEKGPAAASGNLSLLGPDGATVVGMGNMGQGGFVVVSQQNGDRYLLLNHNQFGSGLFVKEQDQLTALQVLPPSEESEDDSNGEQPETDTEVESETE